MGKKFLHKRDRRKTTSEKKLHEYSKICEADVCLGTYTNSRVWAGHLFGGSTKTPTPKGPVETETLESTMSPANEGITKTHEPPTLNRVSTIGKVDLTKLQSPTEDSMVFDA